MRHTWSRLFTHPVLVFHWLWFTPNQCSFSFGITPTHCFFSIGHGLHPRIFMSWVSRPLISIFSGSHFVDKINDRMFLSTSSAGFIAGFSAGQGNILQEFWYLKPLRIRIDVRVMATKGYSTFPCAPGLEPASTMDSVHSQTQNISLMVGGAYSSAENNF